MLQSKNTVLTSSNVFDLSLISSILFVILLFSSTSSGFDVESTITRTISKDVEIVMMPKFSPIEPRPPKPEEPDYEIGELDEPEPIEPIEFYPEVPILEPSDPTPEISLEDTDDKEIWEISIQPKLELKVTPKYPLLAMRSGIEATVFIEYILDENGHPTRFKIISGNVMLNDAAITALKQFRFAPGIQNGKAVKVKMRQLFKFSIK
jgi:protein TonB